MNNRQRLLEGTVEELISKLVLMNPKAKVIIEHPECFNENDNLNLYLYDTDCYCYCNSYNQQENTIIYEIDNYGDNSLDMQGNFSGKVTICGKYEN